MFEKLLGILLDKSGGIEVGSEEPQGQENTNGEENKNDTNNNDNAIESAIKKLNDRLDTIAKSLATDKTTKEVNEDTKNEIIKKFKEEIIGEQTQTKEEIAQLQASLQQANETIRGYQLNGAISKITNANGINSDGIELFSKVLDKTNAFDDKGNIVESEIDKQAKAFIEKYPVFSLRNKSFGVYEHSFTGVSEHSQPDVSKMTATQKLEAYYNNFNK